MSKTYRRRHSDCPSWVPEKYMWHADSQKIAANAPKCFRQELNRKYRSHANWEISRINREADYENYIFNPDYNNAN